MLKSYLLKLIGFGLNTMAIFLPRIAGKYSFQLFCYPFRSKLKPRHYEFFNSSNRSEVISQENKIQIYQWGNGPKNILLLHGWQSHSYQWKAYVNSFDKNRYTVFAIDAPGHGLSSGNFMTVPVYGEAIKKVIEKIGKVYAVVGHSLGSFTALYTFYEHQELRPEKIVLLAPPADASEFLAFYKSTLSLSTRTLSQTISTFEEVVQKKPVYFSALVFARHLGVEGLIIHDEDDLETSVENGRLIHESWPNSIFITTKGNGHNLRSSEVVSHVIKFIGDEKVPAGNVIPTMEDHLYQINNSTK